MARKIVDIGTLGNDGTGDSIRESFRKVNDNFRELYGSLGLGERLSFLGLDQTPDTFEGQENAIVAVNNTESALQFKQIVAGSGIQLDFTSNPNEISVSTIFSEISADPDPQLGGNLSARSGGTQYRIQDLVTPITSDEAVNKAYADSKVGIAGVDSIDPATGSTNSAFGRMSGPLILSRDPQPSDDEIYGGLIAATKRYVDNAAFGSVANLYVATSGEDSRVGVSSELQGRALAYAYRTIEAALKRAEELVNESRLEIGPYKKVLTYSNGAEPCTLSSITTAPSSGAGFSGTVFMSISSIEINAPGINYLPGDIITISGGIGDPARYEVLDTSSSPGSILTIREISAGKYSVLPGTSNIASTTDSAFGEQATFDITYNVNSVIIDNPGSGYGLVSVRFESGGGSGAFGTATVNPIDGSIDTITITDRGEGFTTIPTCVVNLPRFKLFTDGRRTDFTGDVTSTSPLAIRGRDIREGLYIRGETSGALAQILAHDGSLDGDDEIFDVDIIYGAFEIGETIAYGDVSRTIQISIFVESGTYEENYPLKIPQNVSIVGDEFRRCIVRPRLGTSSSPWAFGNFRRDVFIDRLRTADQLYGYHYLSTTTHPVYPLVNNPGFYDAAAALLLLNKDFLTNEVVSWIDYQIENDITPFSTVFLYNRDLCSRDVGLIVESIAFDLKYGGYNRTISAGLKYKQNASGLIAITSQLSETVAAIEYLDYLCQRVILNQTITTAYSNYTQIANAAFQSERGAGAIERTIDSITKANPCVVDTFISHGYKDRELITISGAGGMVELNDNDYYVKYLTATTFELYNDFDLTDPVDSTGFTDYVLGSGGSITPQGGAIGILIDALIDVMSNSASVNYPNDNDTNDVFLMNDATIVRALTIAGHGGFAMVLDPDGQILAKSPYAQEGAVFSKSTGYKGFHGGMFVDGFTGNIQFRIDSKISPTRLQVSGLIKPPQLPCSFIVDDIVYRINYLRQFIYYPGSSTAQFELDETTPFDLTIGNISCVIATGDPTIITSVGHGLQPGATIRFTTTGSLPGGIEAAAYLSLESKDYYVLGSGLTANTFRISEFVDGTSLVTTSTGSGTFTYERIYEVLMPGNRSMLSNDFTQVNDMGYGLIATNGGLTEAVSMFTYYCHISYYSLNGGQIRSIAGSSSHGNFALVAEGSDPLEVPTPVSIYHNMQQVAYVYSSTAETENVKGGTIIYVTYTDYLPLSGSEVEINHANGITTYAATSVVLIDGTINLARITIGSSGGLQAAVTNGQAITVRQNSYVVLTGDVVDVTTRPSTALKIADSNFIYRVLDFADYNNTVSADVFNVVSITKANPCVITTDVPHRQIPSYTIKIILNEVDTIAGFFDIGESYEITSVGTTDFTLIGAASNTTGVTFTATGIGSGDGTANKLAGTPESIESSASFANATIYYVSNVIDEYSFTVSEVDGGTEVDASADADSLFGEVLMEPYGLTLTQLRENYDYIELGSYGVQPYVGSTTACTVTPSVSSSSPAVINAVGHGLSPGDQIRFSSSTRTLPSELTTSTYHWVINEDLTSDTFKVSSFPPISSSQIGIGGVLSGNSISGLTSTTNLRVGMSLIPKANITGATVVGDGTTATVTFSQTKVPPFIKGQAISISGFSDPGFNGTNTVLSCTTTTFTYANGVTGTDTGGTISVTYSGDLGTNPTIISIESATSITITSTGPSDGTVIFDTDGAGLVITTTGSNVVYGSLLGDQGQDTIAIAALNEIDASRIGAGISSGNYYTFTYEGTTYDIIDYQDRAATGQDYALMQVSPTLERSGINSTALITFKGAIPNQSSFGVGTLTIRISLTRVTGHDLLEIGTGSYADTNYPNEIYGPPKNTISEVPVFATDTDEDGATVGRAQMQERSSGRTFFVTTDQFGNFNVGPFFRVDQGTGSVTFSASLALSQLDGLGFKRGATVSEFSIDDSMSDAAIDSVPTESAVVGYVSRRLGVSPSGVLVSDSSLIPVTTGGFLALSGVNSMRANLNLDTNKLINVGDPEDPEDGVNLRSLTFKNFQDVEINEPNANEILVFTGDGDGSINAEVVGDVSLGIDSTANTVDIQINPGVIIDSDVNSTAGVQQSKLALNLATTLPTAPTGTAAAKQAASGVASFKDTTFTIVDGHVTLKTATSSSTGVLASQIQWIPATSVLGYSGTASGGGAISSVTMANVASLGGAITKSLFGTGTGFIKKSSTGAASGTGGTFTIIDSDSNNVGNTLVQRDTNGDFGARIVSISSLIVDSKLCIDTETADFGVSGFMKYRSYLGAESLLIGDGPDTTDKITFLYNDSFEFWKANRLAYAPVTCGTLTTTALTTGSSATSGTVTGNWTLTTGSRWHATYADLAEYYESDTEYEPGTVLIFGGSKEVTVTSNKMDHRIAGVVSDQAAFIMNEDCPGTRALLALQGRVPCRVVGKVSKGDLMVTSNIRGVAVSAGGDAKAGTIIGKALEDYDSDHIGTIEVAVGRA